MGIQVKICGLCNGADVEAVAALAPDALGFIFCPASPRAVDAVEVASWVRDLPPGILRVGVFVDRPLVEVREIVETAGLDVAQFHGRERPDGCVVAEVHGWKAVHLERLPEADLSAYPVDAFLVDGYCVSSPGGTGVRADWDAAAAFVRAAPKPVWLAGGLTPENVGGAIERVRPHGVDVSSGVETRPGAKDLQRVKEFIERCRAT